MKNSTNRLRRQYGALVEYGQFLENHRPSVMPPEWKQCLGRVGYDPYRIDLMHGLHHFYLYAPTDADKVKYTLMLGEDEVAKNKLSQYDEFYPWGPVCARDLGFLYYGRPALCGSGLDPVVAENVMILIRFWAFDDELASILDALPVRAYGVFRRKKAGYPGFQDVAWGDTIRLMKRAVLKDAQSPGGDALECGGPTRSTLGVAGQGSLTKKMAAEARVLMLKARDLCDEIAMNERETGIAGGEADLFDGFDSDLTKMVVKLDAAIA